MNSRSIQQSYIGGRYVPSASGERFDDINPATGEVQCVVEQAGAAEVELAVKAAKEGFAVWSAMTGAERGRILHRPAQILRARNREIAELEVRDTGKPIQEAEAVDILPGADRVEYCAGLAAFLHGEHFQLKGAFAYRRREPLGICVGIGAWNYPIQIACCKSAPALACGNAMIFKPAELTPLTAAVLAEIYTVAGVPTSVFNVVQGDARTGQLLVRHPAVAKVSSTGEVGTGKRVMADAATTLKHVTMELGGKSPLIIFGVADLCGGNRVTGRGLDRGFFVEPTVFADCTDDLEIVREEIFGPVMSVRRFSDEADVVSRANDTPFGLAAGVFTRDLTRAHRVVAALQAGVCWINNYNITPVEIPFGGTKLSGIGRENGLVTIEHYTQLKSVYVEMSDVACPY